jgi:hypothetical protein
VHTLQGRLLIRHWRLASILLLTQRAHEADVKMHCVALLVASIVLVVVTGREWTISASKFDSD